MNVTIDQLKECRRQRDELLAALEEIISVLQHHFVDACAANNKVEHGARYALQRARAIVAHAVKEF